MCFFASAVLDAGKVDYFKSMINDVEVDKFNTLITLITLIIAALTILKCHNLSS